MVTLRESALTSRNVNLIAYHTQRLDYIWHVTENIRMVDSAISSQLYCYIVMVTFDVANGDLFYPCSSNLSPQQIFFSGSNFIVLADI
jgi:hypothetical protein